MKKELNRALNDALRAASYRRVANYVFRAEWSTDEVEHFLYFDVYDSNWMQGWFGMRNAKAEAFSRRCIKEYGGRTYTTVSGDIGNDCLCNFSLGRLFGWNRRESLFVDISNLDRLSDAIREDVRLRLLPLIRGVLTLNDLLRVLLYDFDNFPTWSSNTAIRAAQIIAIVKMMGLDIKAIHSAVLNLQPPISLQLRGSIGPDEFLCRVTDDAINSSELIEN